MCVREVIVLCYQSCRKEAEQFRKRVDLAAVVGSHIAGAFGPNLAWMWLRFCTNMAATWNGNPPLQQEKEEQAGQLTSDA